MTTPYCLAYSASSAPNAPSESLFFYLGDVRHQEVALEESFLLKGKFRQVAKREGKKMKWKGKMNTKEMSLQLQSEQTEYLAIQPALIKYL